MSRLDLSIYRSNRYPYVPLTDTLYECGVCKIPTHTPGGILGWEFHNGIMRCKTCRLEGLSDLATESASNTDEQ